MDGLEGKILLKSMNGGTRILWNLHIYIYIYVTNNYLERILGKKLFVHQSG